MEFMLNKVLISRICLCLILVSCSPSTSLERTGRYWDKQIEKSQKREQKAFEKEFYKQLPNHKPK